MLTRSYARKRRTIYFRLGNSKKIKVSRPHVNKRNRLILGSERKKQRGRGWNNLIAQGFDRALKKILC